MNQLTELARTKLERQFGPVWSFEHGPASEDRAVGCGTDHAHLHLVPLSFDLIEAARPWLPSDGSLGLWEISGAQLAVRKGIDYLYVRTPNGKEQYLASRNIGSQVFRKAIASSLGEPARYSWREYPFMENISATFSRLLETDANGAPVCGGASLRGV